MQEVDLPPTAKLFARTVHLMPSPSPWPTLGRMALELVALLAAGLVAFGWFAATRA